MSKLRVDTIVNEANTGAPNFAEGLSANGNITATGNITASGNVSVGGTLTYNDVTNIDSVGLVTARSGLNVSSGVGTFAGGVNVTGGNVTLRGLSYPTSDGNANEVLKTNGSGTLSFGAVSSSGGKVLAYVSREDNTEYRVNTGTTWNDIQGGNLELPITPSATSSRILVMFNWGAITSWDSSCLGYGKIMRKVGGGSYADLTIGADSSGYGQAMFGLNLEKEAHQSSNGLCCTFIDHPNTTSQVTYRPFYRTEGGGGHIYINKNPRNNTHDISAVAFAYALELAG